jgi:hypothetical protein
MIGRWRALVADLSRNALAEYGIETKTAPEVFGRLLGDVYWGAEAEILSGEDPRLHVEAIRLLGNLFRWMALDQRRGKTREAAAGNS